MRAAAGGDGVDKRGGEESWAGLCMTCDAKLDCREGGSGAETGAGEPGSVSSNIASSLSLTAEVAVAAAVVLIALCRAGAREALGRGGIAVVSAVGELSGSKPRPSPVKRPTPAQARRARLVTDGKPSVAKPKRCVGACGRRLRGGRMSTCSVVEYCPA